MKILFLAQIFIITLFFNDHRYQLLQKIVRIGVVSCVLIFLGYFIYSKNNYFGEQLPIQLINKNPEPLDFYSIEVGKDEDKVNHIGKIRPNYYSIVGLEMSGTDEFWLVGLKGENIKYFTQHVVQNKNEDMRIEASYLNQSIQLSEKAKEEILHHEEGNKSEAVWVGLNVLFLFVNLVTLLSGKKKSH